MNILIIGNGFDLANGLPTRYSDFLKICRIVKTSLGQFATDPSLFYGEKPENTVLHSDFCRKVQKDYFSEFYKIVKDNLFVRYFLEREAVIGENWMNFEEEIEHLIELLIKEMNETKDERYRPSGLRSLKEYLRSSRAEGINTYKDFFFISEKSIVVWLDHWKYIWMDM